MEFVIITGLSGAGKSKAASFLEDVGFYRVDNIPTELIPRFGKLCMDGGERYQRVVLVTDIRGSLTFDNLFDALAQLDEMGLTYKIVFADCDTDVIINRYKETRRKHPLAMQGESLHHAVERERELLQPIRKRADAVVDSSALSTAKLRGEILSLVEGGLRDRAMTVTVQAFGFKYGLPLDADLVFDVRFLPNPHYIPNLRPLSGLDAPVRDFVFSYEQTKAFVQKVEELLHITLPAYVEEGKTNLVIAVGCTGGRHRSVAIARELNDYVARLGYATDVSFRDLGR